MLLDLFYILTSIFMAVTHFCGHSLAFFFFFFVQPVNQLRVGIIFQHSQKNKQTVNPLPGIQLKVAEPP